MRLWKRLATVVAVLATGLAVPTPASAAGIEGIDVSAYQHPINWTSVKNSGRAFAFIKATEGQTYTNSYFASDYAGARGVGIIRGAYHYARPDSGANDAVLEARYFVNVAGTFGTAGELPAVLDLEANGGLSVSALRTWTQAWLTEVERLTGRAPIIYTGPSFWQTSMGNSTAFTRYPLWIAHYTSGSPIVPGGWGAYTFWQYTDSASVPGISGGVDGDRFNGSLADLQALAQGGPPAGPCGVVELNRTAYPALQPGSTDTAAVCALQTLLVSAGQSVTVDGAYNDATKTAVGAFQTATGVYGGADGLATTWTWTALLARGSSYPTLREGSTGEAVVRLQRALTAALGRPLSQDGVFGPLTTTAVKSYQTAYAPPADGAVGTGTWGHLRTGR